MDTRLATVKSLIKILEQEKTFDEVVNFYAEKIKNYSEYLNLVSGAVKFKIALDFFIEKFSTRSFKKISPPIKNILRASIYELEYLKTPDYAVINSYVEISKKYEKNSSGFVNAVLREFSRENQKVKLPDSLSIKFSHPEWLIEKWVQIYGEEETIKICEYNNTPPVLSIRINTLKTTKPALMTLFTDNNIEFQESKISDECLILKNTGNIKNIIGYKEGLWLVQGESSSLAAKMLEPEPNEKILDLCAAPGGKTAHIAALMQNKGEITAVDISEKRIKKIKENCERLDITCVKTITGDASEYASGSKYDRILIDAPCSNTGVFAKRPDARWKRTPEDVKNLTKLQMKILKNASTLLKKGGVLVYSTCSIEPEENLLLVQEFLEMDKNFTLEKHVQILQSMHNADGFFIAKLLNK